MDNQDFEAVVAAEPVVEAAPVAEEVEEQDDLGELYDHVIPDISAGLSVDALNLAYKKLWDIEFEKWVVHSSITELSQQLAEMKASQAFLESKAILSGENTGSNPEKRAAWNQEKFADNYNLINRQAKELAAKQVELAEVEMVHSICKSNITRLETILKLAETSTMISYMNQSSAPQPEPQPASANIPVILVPGAQNQKH